MNHANTYNLDLVRTALETLTGRAGGLPGIGVLYGPAGWGKTTAMVVVANVSRAYYVQMRSAWGRKALLEKILIEMGLPARGTIAQMLDEICEQLAKSGRMLMIDEFDFALKGDATVELVRDIYEGSQSSIMLAGEELLPRKLARWERFHSRVLSWVPAQPVSIADARLLAPVYCETPCAEDFLGMLVEKAAGSVRRVAVNLAQAGQLAALAGWRKIDLKTWADRPIYTGRAPARTLPEGC
jgi:hypothetical protein